MFWKRGLLGLAVVLPVAVVVASSKPKDFSPRRLPAFDAPPGVRAIVERSCADCHSEETRWPWYAHVPPVSWQIQSDVRDARAVMNFSEWGDYTSEERRDFAAQIARAARARVMPPPKYLWMHRDAVLSGADLEALKRWAAGPAGGFAP